MIKDEVPYLRDLLQAGQVRGVGHPDFEVGHAVVVDLLGHRVTPHVRAHHEPVGVKLNVN